MKNIVLSLAILFSLSIFPVDGTCEDNPPADALSKLQGGAIWTGAAVSPGLQKVWTDYQKTGDNSRKVRCLIILRDSATSEIRAALANSGFVVQSLTGAAGRGYMYIKDLPNVATNPVLKSIKLATE